MKIRNKITIFIGGLGGGGAERVVCNLANYLVKKGWDVCILTMSDKESAYPLHADVKRHALSSEHKRKFLIYNFVVRYFNLIKYIKTEKSDCFVVMLPATSLMILSLRKLINGKIIVSERSSPLRYSRSMRSFLKILAHRADGYVFQTEESCKWYMSYIKKSKTVIIPNAVNEEFLLDCGNVVKENRIVTVGRLIGEKNFPLLIKAYSKIADKYPNYKAFIFGEGTEKNNLERLIKEFGLENNIVIAGFTENIKNELQKSKLFVMPSDYEGMPNALIEAMALGLPCIATDCEGGGARFLIQHGTNGFLVEKRNPEQMAYYMDLVLSSEELAKCIGGKAKEIKAALNPNQIYSTWENFIKNVMDIT